MSLASSILDAKQQKLFIPVTEFQGLVAAAGVGTGVPVHEEIATLTPGLGALEMAAAADDIAHMMAVPTDWDRRHPISVRFVWSSQSATAADTVDWKFLYKLMTPDSTVIAVPSTALDTVIPQETVVGVANTLQRTAPGIINGNTIADAAEYIIFLCEMDALAAGLSEKVYFHGIEFGYTPKWSKHGSNMPAKP